MAQFTRERPTGRSLSRGSLDRNIDDRGQPGLSLGSEAGPRDWARLLLLLVEVETARGGLCVVGCLQGRVNTNAPDAAPDTNVRMVPNFIPADLEKAIIGVASLAASVGKIVQRWQKFQDGLAWTAGDGAQSGLP